MSPFPVRTLLRIALAAVFLWAGMAKLLDRPGDHTLYGSLVGRWALPHYSFCAIELALGVWLLCGRRPTGSATLAAVVLAFFMGILVSGLIKENAEPCGCGFSRNAGPAGQIRRDLYATLAIDGILFGIACSLRKSVPGGRAPGPDSPRPENRA